MKMLHELVLGTYTIIQTEKIPHIKTRLKVDICMNLQSPKNRVLKNMLSCFLLRVQIVM